jgi:O-antigen/teichoic acid export membrane protein
MREVSRKRSDANRYLVNTTILRIFTGLGAAIPIALYVLLLGTGQEPLGRDTTLAILLLIAGMIPGGVNTGLTALFYAYEKAEIPAACTTIATILKVSLGAVALALGTGFVGLAAVSILVNLVTMLLLGTLAVRAFFVPRWEFDRQLQRKMVGESFPLMLNHLLQTLFFKVDVLLLERLGGKVMQASGNTVVGWYSTSYKWIDALNIIPAFFTFAAFPVLSRQAEESTESMLRTYRLAVKLLVMISLPLAVMTYGLAPNLIRLLGGSEYLPHGAIALQLMIWSIPIGWVNSITNYVLIALGRQRMLTRAFVIGLTFNLGANLLLLPVYGYPAAAVIAIFSELALAIAFYHYLKPVLGPIRWTAMLWRPVAAAGAMAAVSLALSQAHWTLGMATGIVVYCGALAILRYLSPAELELLARILPTRPSKPESPPPVLPPGH